MIVTMGPITEKDMECAKDYLRKQFTVDVRPSFTCLRRPMRRLNEFFGLVATELVHQAD